MIYDVNGNGLISTAAVEVPVYPDSVGYDVGCSMMLYDNFWKYRTTPLIAVNGKTIIRVDSGDSATVDYFNVYEYSEATKDNIAFIQAIRNLSFTDNAYTYTPSTGTKYIRVTLVLTNNTTTSEYQPLVFESAYGIDICKNPNIVNTSAGSVLTFSYVVNGDTFTSGQMILPPNYSIHGNPCPLVVILHGTSSMNTWTQEIGTNSGTSTRYLLNYLANEGFAVFDCYCFTSEYYSANYQNQAAPLPVFLQAYTEGIKYVCKYYNVDINNVSAFAMSAGGNLGHMVLHGCGDVRLKSLAMLCPSTGFASTIFRTFFLHSSMRSLIVNYLGLSNETGASTFISTDNGLDNATARNFVLNHLDSFAGLICGAIGVNGSTFEDQYDWMTTGVTDLPQWMTDLNLPGIASGWTTSPATGIPALVNHPDLSAYTPLPVKFWQAFDDVNVSGHANYTIYNWLKNGGSEVYWRTMPQNSGGHHAVDTDANALKSSGTTRLGISYSNIATAYVEMADFFYQNMGQ